MSAVVRAPLQQGAAPNEATIIFSLSVGEGSFTNHVLFQLVGKPEIAIEKNFNVLAAEQLHDLPYRLVGCGESPQVSFVCPSGLVEADVGVGFDAKQRFLRISPAEAAVEWDNSAFIKPVRCSLEVQYGEKPDEQISADFVVALCYEGIGTAFLNTPNNSAPEEILIPCDAFEAVREQKTFALPLTVMLWNPDKRALEPNSAAVKALSLEVLLQGNSNMRPGSEAYSKFQNMVEKAKITLGETNKSVKTEAKFSPTVFGLRATGEVADADIELLLTFSSALPQIMPLTLKAKTSNNVDYKAMIRWLLTYPDNSYASQFIQLGDVSLYHKALDHIIGVFQYDRTPNLAKGFRHRSTENYYEHGKRDIARDPFIALHVLPTGIGDLKGVALLYHELTHTLEDLVLDERDGIPENGCERNGHLVEELAKAVHHLCDAEKSGGNTLASIKEAIDCLSYAVNDPYVKKWLAQAMASDLPKFGAKYTALPKEMFYHYAVNYSGPNEEAVRRAIRRAFCPANLQGAYDIIDGLFAGGTLNASWNFGNLHRVSLQCPGFSFDPQYVIEWVPDKVRLVITISCAFQRDGASYKEHVDLTLEGNLPYLFDNVEYQNMPELHATWMLAVPPGKKFYDPPPGSPFFNLRQQSSRLKKRS